MQNVKKRQVYTSSGIPYSKNAKLDKADLKNTMIVFSSFFKPSFYTVAVDCNVHISSNNIAEQQVKRHVKISVFDSHVLHVS